MQRTLTIIALAASGLFTIDTTTSAETITVCASGCDFADVQAAIDSAEDGDVIEVATGRYEVADNPTPDGINRSLNTKGKKLTIRGETDDSGDPVTVFTIKDNAWAAVITCYNGETADTVFENLAITGARGTPDAPPMDGYPGFGSGARCMDSSSPTFKNCHFYNNGGYWYEPTYPPYTITTPAGGGVMIFKSDPSFLDCLFRDNILGPSRGAAALIVEDSSPVFQGCTFRDNSQAMAVDTSAPTITITDCTFSDNISGKGDGPDDTGGPGGGAINLSDACELSVSHTTFQNNQGFEYGGAILVTYTDLDTSQPFPVSTFSSCTFTGNAVIDPETPSMRSPRLAVPQGGGQGGGAVYAEYQMLVFDRCHFVGNKVDLDQSTSIVAMGGAVMSLGFGPSFTSCVIKNNSLRSISTDPNEGSAVQLLQNLGCQTIGDTSDFRTTFSKTTICGNTGSTEQISGYIDGQSTCPGDPWVLDESCVQTRCSECPDPGSTGDINGDGVVDVADYHELGDQLGICQGDINGDGNVDAADLGLLIGAWGLCP